MHDDHVAHAVEQVRQFFVGAAALSPVQLRELQRVHRSRTTSRLAFAVHPDRLVGVSTGQWTPAHDLLVAQVQAAARQHAARLAPLGRRRVLALVLEGAALAVLVDSLPDPVLSPALRERLSGPWTTLVGPLTGSRPVLQDVAAQ